MNHTNHLSALSCIGKTKFRRRGAKKTKTRWVVSAVQTPFIGGKLSRALFATQKMDFHQIWKISILLFLNIVHYLSIRRYIGFALEVAEERQETYTVCMLRLTLAFEYRHQSVHSRVKEV
jgi:hypothetical protein